jgi:hypothetical protein
MCFFALSILKVGSTYFLNAFSLEEFGMDGVTWGFACVRNEVLVIKREGAVT